MYKIKRGIRKYVKKQHTGRIKYSYDDMPGSDDIAYRNIHSKMVKVISGEIYRIKITRAHNL